MIDRNIVSVKEGVEWGYSLYTDEGAPEWVEKLVLSEDKYEFIDILKLKFKLDGHLTFEQKAGEVAFRYKTGEINLYTAINELLFDLYPDDKELEKEKSKLYLAEDYYGWEDNIDPDIKALEEAGEIIDKYHQAYITSYEKITHNNGN